MSPRCRRWAWSPKRWLRWCLASEAQRKFGGDSIEEFVRNADVVPSDPAMSRKIPVGHLVLVGMMGSGKTTVGRIVAERLGRPFFDSDAMIERTRRPNGSRDLL